jgi:hypothetical protein
MGLRRPLGRVQAVEPGIIEWGLGYRRYRPRTGVWGSVPPFCSPRKPAFVPPRGEHKKCNNFNSFVWCSPLYPPYLIKKRKIIKRGTYRPIGPFFPKKEDACILGGTGGNRPKGSSPEATVPPSRLGIGRAENLAWRGLQGPGNRRSSLNLVLGVGWPLSANEKKRAKTDGC